MREDRKCRDGKRSSNDYGSRETLRFLLANKICHKTSKKSK